ncbi:MAG: type II toxin-antitoxin system VapC family toxin [SAR202 cluster bacterium]|nr:type II toxin-antitoxin system VapC family toxin [SAR202 cluster bacterium]
MKLIDANMVIYAVGLDHPLREPSLKIIEHSLENTDGYAIDAETIQEILYVFDYRHQKKFGIEIAEKLLGMFGSVVPVTTSEVSLAIHLFERYPRLQSRDAIHAAVAIVNGMDGIISADKAFDGIEGLRRFNPLEVASSL